MMKTRSALELLLRHEVPSLSAADAATLLDTKFRCLAAIQTYAEVDADAQILAHTFYETKDKALAFTLALTLTLTRWTPTYRYTHFMSRKTKP